MYLKLCISMGIFERYCVVFFLWYLLMVVFCVATGQIRSAQSGALHSSERIGGSGERTAQQTRPNDAAHTPAGTDERRPGTSQQASRRYYSSFSHGQFSLLLLLFP